MKRCRSPSRFRSRSSRFKRLPQRAGEVWQGDIVRLPMWVEHQIDPNGPPFRPTGVLWVSMRTGLVHLDLAKEGEQATPELALATFLEFGLKWAKGLEGRPARVEVRDPSRLRDTLAGPLATLDTAVALVDGTARRSRRSPQPRRAIDWRAAAGPCWNHPGCPSIGCAPSLTRPRRSSSRGLGTT